MILIKHILIDEQAISNYFLWDRYQLPVNCICCYYYIPRWWLETFVLAQAYADLYNGGNTEAEIAALNNGESKYSDYMRPGFEFLQEMIDCGSRPDKSISSSSSPKVLMVSGFNR